MRMCRSVRTEIAGFGGDGILMHVEKSTEPV